MSQSQLKKLPSGKTRRYSSRVALRQAKPLDVVASFVDWSSVEGDPEELRLQLEEALQQIDFGEPAPQADSHADLPWIWEVTLESHDDDGENCQEVIEVE